MHIVLLSGGSGKRLWPLSNDLRSKQFIKLFKKDDGEYESMLQRVCRHIRAADADAELTVATAKAQVAAIRNQLGEDMGVCVEPCRRDTFPAIALAAAYLRDVRGVCEDEAIVVCPVDPYAGADYFAALKELWKIAESGAARITLMGIAPSYPSEKYGYIIPRGGGALAKVEAFREKPSEADARKYIERGALWNGGVFALKLGYVLDRARERFALSGYEELLANYAQLPKVSFDYAVVEREPSLAVMRFAGEWKDIGTWNTLTETMSDRVIGDARLDTCCEDLQVVNETDLPILCMGLKRLIVAASPEGILICDKDRSSFIKPYVESIGQEPRFAEKSWGSYLVLDLNSESLTIKVTLLPGHGMHYHSHEHRSESWTVLSGTGSAIIDGERIEVRPGSLVRLPIGCRHTLIARTKLTAIEVQLGREISVRDKIKYPLDP